MTYDLEVYDSQSNDDTGLSLLIILGCLHLAKPGFLSALGTVLWFSI